MTFSPLMLEQFHNKFDLNCVLSDRQHLAILTCLETINGYTKRNITLNRIRASVFSQGIQTWLLRLRVWCPTVVHVPNKAMAGAQLYVKHKFVGYGWSGYIKAQDYAQLFSSGHFPLFNLYQFLTEQFGIIPIVCAVFRSVLSSVQFCDSF